MIPLIDLAAQRERIDADIRARIDAVLAHGRFIMGPEVGELETALAQFCGAGHAVSCGSGTDALLMVLMAQGVGRGDAVIVPAFTFPATPEVVVLTGATPVFCDVRADTFNLDPDLLPDAIEAAERAGLRPVGVIAVDLFGQPAEYEPIDEIARQTGMWVLADAAQSMGGALGSRPVGSLGDLAATSFFPAKPLGAYGDGGAVFTDDEVLASELRSIREHGKGRDKYEIRRIGLNARLDTMQAAVLLAKLEVFADEIERRQVVAARYDAALDSVVRVPTVLPTYRSAWAQYTVLVPERERIRAALDERGVQTAVYYPKGLHHQRAYAEAPTAASGLAVTEELAGQVLSLPMHPYLEADAQAAVVDALIGALSA
jgi:dTDP-4-amino-4,6-dideoxygalactose transaminase